MAIKYGLYGKNTPKSGGNLYWLDDFETKESAEKRKQSLINLGSTKSRLKILRV